MNTVAASAAGALRDVLQQYRIVHSITGRVRMRPIDPEAVRKHFDHIARVLSAGLPSLFPGATITISTRTGSVLVLFTETTVPPQLLAMPLPETTPLRLGSSVKQDKAHPAVIEEAAVRNPIPGKILSILFYPPLLSGSIAVFRAIPYIFSAIRTLFQGKLNLEALDGAALLVCLLQRDFRSLSSITFFFALGEYLAYWTKKKSRASLEESLALNIETVWIRKGEVEQEIPFTELAVGDEVVVRAGSALPVDGEVVDGQGMVNQASMTGESLPVLRKNGSSVYAGTILEEGELVVKASKVGSDTRINSIVRTIEESENVKASIQGKYEHMADAIVPYNFMLSGIVFALTRNLTRAGSVLLVDYSCAIRLGTPLSIFTAMRMAADQGTLIKGGKYMEAIAEADTVVFDKTGTLTKAQPVLVDIVPFQGMSRQEVLALAACLEEHFVHPVGQAVVRASDAEGLKHREEHAKVEYIVAHGIVSTWNEKRVLIGSGHFVLEDEKIELTLEQEQLIAAEADKGRSILYLSVGGALAGLLMIEDEIRDNTASVISRLRLDGVRRIIMLTGDGERTAAGIAQKAGIHEYRSQMLPEGKAAFIEQLKAEGCRVAMIGDGINDSLALAAADVGIAMNGGADLAREVADIVLLNEDLESLLFARNISRRALQRVKKGFRTSVCLNSLFLIGGLFGLLTPGVSALLHNATTAGIAIGSVQPFEAKLTRQIGTASPAEERSAEK